MATLPKLNDKFVTGTGFIDVGDISITELPIPTTVVDDASMPES